MELKFGQSAPGIVQFAYVVEDIHQAISTYNAMLNVGPWFLNERYQFRDALYHDEPTDIEMKVAIGFAGHMSIELIEQTNDAPSVYLDHIEKKGFGFHHSG